MAAGRGPMYAKMAGVFLACSLGGPLLMYYVTPAEGELFKRFSPDLQKRNLELRDERTKNYQEFVKDLKEYSKSDKPIWVAADEANAKRRLEIIDEERAARQEREKIRAEMKAQALGRRQESLGRS